MSTWNSHVNQAFWSQFGKTQEQRELSLACSDPEYVAMSKITSYVIGTATWAWEKLFG